MEMEELLGVRDRRVASVQLKWDYAATDEALFSIARVRKAMEMLAEAGAPDTAKIELIDLDEYGAVKATWALE